MQANVPNEVFNDMLDKRYAEQLQNPDRKIISQK